MSSVSRYSSMTEKQLKTFIFANAVARTVYDNHGNPDGKSFLKSDTLVSAMSVVTDNSNHDPFNLSEKDTKGVYCVTFKGSDDALDFVRDVSQKGVKDASMEARYNLFEKIAADVEKNIKSHDGVLISGHSLGGYLATEFALYLKERNGEAWWRENGKKIEVTTIDPIGFSKEYASSNIDPATQNHLVISESIADRSRSLFGGNKLVAPKNLGPCTVKVAGAHRNIPKFDSGFASDLLSISPMGLLGLKMSADIHSSDDIQEEMMAALYALQYAEGRPSRCPSFEPVGQAKLYKYSVDNDTDVMWATASEVMPRTVALLRATMKLADVSVSVGRADFIGEFHDDTKRINMNMDNYRSKRAGSVEEKEIASFPNKTIQKHQ